MESREEPKKESSVTGKGTKENPYTYRNAVTTSPQEVVEKVARKKWGKAKMGIEIFFRFDMEGRFYIRPHPNNDNLEVFAFQPVPTDTAGNIEDKVDIEKLNLINTAAVLFTGYANSPKPSEE